jgi:xylulokinase
VAEHLGLQAGLSVATGAHDGAAAAIGAGAAFAGAHPVTLGTNTVYRILTAEASASANRFWTVLPGLTAYGADVTLGGYAVDWVVRLAGGTHERLGSAAAQMAPGAEGVVFLPQMGGRVLPEPSSGVAAAFSGLRRSSRREHLYRAALEGNAFALRAVREALLAQGLPEGPIYLTGGGTRSPLWREVLAAVFGSPVRWAGVEEGCRGGAICAAVAAGAFRDIEEAVGAMAGGAKLQEPGADAGRYEDVYRRFVAVREALDRA